MTLENRPFKLKIKNIKINLSMEREKNSDLGEEASSSQLSELQI